MHKSKFHGAFVLNRRVDLQRPTRWLIHAQVDARVVAEAADRARLAKKLADAERHAARDRAGRDWARRAADAADLVLDDDAAVGEAGGAQQRDLDEMLEEAGASRPQGRMAVVNADTLRMLAEERVRGDGPRPREKKRRKKRK